MDATRLMALVALASSGEELKKLLREHGSFGTIEVILKKRLVKSKESEQEGGWYSKTYLTTKEGWTKRQPQRPI